MLRNILFFSLLLVFHTGNAQRELTVIPTFQNSPIELNRNYSLTGSDTFALETIKFYVSDIRVFGKDTREHSLSQPYFLIDLSKPSSQVIDLENTDIQHLTSIQFNLGIDSSTNVAGAMEGDLDPTYGMYWTWQSGYINVKIEGTSTLCPARKHFFQYHLGGYQFPYNAVQSVQLNISNDSKFIYLPLDSLLTEENISTTYEVMRPSAEAIELSVLLSGLFSTE